MHRLLRGSALLGALLPSLVVAAPAEEDGVLVLDESTFGEAIKTNPFILVEFYAPWCGHCKQFAPEYAGAAKVMKERSPPVPLAKVDATVETKLAEDYGVRGYPTIRLFIDGRDQEYTGGRTEQSIVAWLSKKTGPPAIELLDAAAADAFDQEHSIRVIGAFSDGAQKAVFESVARQVEDVFFAHTSSAAVSGKYGLAPPAVRMYFPHDETVGDYAGDFASVEELTAFVKARRQAIVTPFSGETAADLFGDGRPVLFLFRSKDDAGEKAEKEVREAAAGLQRKVLVSIAGESEPMDQRLMDYVSVEPQELPTVRLVTNPTGSMAKYRLAGDITAASVANFVQDWAAGRVAPHLKSEPAPASQPGPVHVLVGSTFDSIVKDPTKDVLVEFYAPWCGHCKKLEPVYRDVAKRLEGVSSMVIAKIDATANDVEGVDVEGFPTIKFWRADKKDSPIDYDGDRDVDSFVSWLDDKASISFNRGEVRVEL
eukprot:TRINITY_DN4220_c0_g3_i1.p1 TRINITY_DN4220_c0_g3~~TRINITY_DN4220_c0_g3_i1.p1  ORF type:complete len:510 (-),score=152.03 TRINITY_DN4220_c0_g3_i1:93-1544(-)